MSGNEALIHLVNGNKIRRSIWNVGNFWHLKNNQLHNEKNIKFNMTFNELIMGDDWEIYDEKVNSLIALDALKTGKKIADIHWAKNKYLHMKDNVILNQDNIKTSISFNCFDENIWTILED